MATKVLNKKDGVQFSFWFYYCYKYPTINLDLRLFFFKLNYEHY